MPNNTSETIYFGHGLNPLRAEKAIVSLGGLQPPVRDVTLDLSDIRHVDVGASWRLGNALSRASEVARITVLLPPDCDLNLPQWYRWLTHSGLGFAIAKYATTILSASRDITTEIRAYYDEPRSIRKLGMPAWSSSTFLLVPDIHSGVLPTDRAARFTGTLRELLLNSQFEVEAYGREEVEALFRLIFEAVQNVFDHADRSPYPPKGSIISHLAVRYFRKISPPKAITREFRSYLERLADAMDPRFDTVGFVEIVVLDDGVGIAARQSQDLDIYRGTFDSERLALAGAFATGASVKLSVHDSTLRGTPGYGFAKITAALRSVQGFAVVRTGRALAFYDGTQLAEVFDTLISPLGPMPGTVLQIVLPRRRARLWSRPDAD